MRKLDIRFCWTDASFILT